jgi:multiple sugar transport system substrate-binding protein
MEQETVVRRARGAGRRTALGVGAVALATALVGVPVVAQDDAFDPMRYAGQTVRIALVAGERDEMGLLDREAEIEEATGIDLEISTEALGDLIASNNQNLEAPESAVDIMHVLGFTVAQTVGAGLFEPLQPYLDDPSKTPADYDFEDFPEGQLEYTGYFDVEAGQFGGDTLYLIPGIHSGSVLLFYRSDLLEEAGLEPPATWDEYLSHAEALTTDDVSGSAMVGANDVSNFTMGGELTSGDKNDGTLRTNLDSPEAVAALQNMIDLLPYSPAAVSAYGFTEALDAFSAGRVAMWPAWATIAGALYGEDSRVADQVAVAQVPSDDGEPRAIRGGWGLGIPANLPQERKDAAWHILTYITSQEHERHQVLNYQTDPNRLSTAQDPEIVEALPYIPEAVAAIESAQILEIANIPETFEIVGAVAREINLALTGTQDAETAMANSQAAALEILQRAGHLSE